jgi:outer membrane immunogenic protein
LGEVDLRHSWIIGAAVGTLFAAPAFAADMPVKAPAKAPAAVATAYNWTGWYVGGNAGYGWGRDTGALWDSHVDPPGVGITNYFASGGNGLPGVKPSGVIGGAQLGYNWQAAPNWVWGLVADIQASDMRGLASNTVNPVFFAASTHTNSSRIDWFGTVRARAGYAANNWLFYGTGGLAYGGVRSDLTFNCFACGPPTIWAGSSSSTQVGWAAGAGIEVGLTPNWTVGIEYLHFDLGSISTIALPNQAALAAGSSVTANSKFAGDIVRATLNFKFSAAPVVAKN